MVLIIEISQDVEQRVMGSGKYRFRELVHINVIELEEISASKLSCCSHGGRYAAI